jgi:hypothetical protein
MKTRRGPPAAGFTMRGSRSTKPRALVTKGYSRGPQWFVVFQKGSRP